MEWLTCTERMLEGDLSWSEKMKDDIRRMDRERSLKKYKERAPLKLRRGYLGQGCRTLP